MISKETILLLKTLESIKDFVVLFHEILDDPSPSQKRVLQRKLKVMEKRLPRLSEDIKKINRKPETKLVTLDSLSEHFDYE